jgi:hypothetical protein
MAREERSWACRARNDSPRPVCNHVTHARVATSPLLRSSWTESTPGPCPILRIVLLAGQSGARFRGVGRELHVVQETLHLFRRHGANVLEEGSTSSVPREETASELPRLPHVRSVKILRPQRSQWRPSVARICTRTIRRPTQQRPTVLEGSSEVALRLWRTWGLARRPGIARCRRFVLRSLREAYGGGGLVLGGVRRD